MATIATSTTFGGTKLYSFKALKDTTTTKLRGTDNKLWIKGDSFALGLKKIRNEIGRSSITIKHRSHGRIYIHTAFLPNFLGHCTTTIGRELPPLQSIEIQSIINHTHPSLPPKKKQFQTEASTLGSKENADMNSLAFPSTAHLGNSIHSFRTKSHKM